MSIATCKHCGSDSVVVDSNNVVWKSTGVNSGYWVLQSYGDSVDCLDCDKTDEPVMVSDYSYIKNLELQVFTMGKATDGNDGDTLVTENECEYFDALVSYVANDDSGEIIIVEEIENIPNDENFYSVVDGLETKYGIQAHHVSA